MNIKQNFYMYLYKKHNFIRDKQKSKDNCSRNRLYDTTISHTGNTHALATTERYLQADPQGHHQSVHTYRLLRK